MIHLPVGLTFHDLLASAPASHGPVASDDFEDWRLNIVLAGLEVAEQAVVLALAHPGVATWSEAATLVGSPTEFGERVRRKVRKLVRRLQGGPADEAGQ